MQDLVHSTMLDQIGTQRERGVDGRMTVALPDPLRSGDAPRFTPEGKRQWNPDWRQDGSSTLNAAFLENTVDLVLDRSKENVSVSLSSWHISTHCYCLQDCRASID